MGLSRLVYFPGPVHKTESKFILERIIYTLSDMCFVAFYYIYKTISLKIIKDINDWYLEKTPAVDGITLKMFVGLDKDVKNM